MWQLIQYEEVGPLEKVLTMESDLGVAPLLLDEGRSMCFFETSSTTL
jgi:hypothetical protein